MADSAELLLRQIALTLNKIAEVAMETHGARPTIQGEWQRH